MKTFYNATKWLAYGLSLMLFLAYGKAHAQWTNVGTAGFSAGGTDNVSLAFHPTTNEPYVVYQDATSSNKTTVMRFTSGAWTIVGTAGFSAGVAGYQCLAIHPTTGEPYVAYMDVANSTKNTVMRFDGTAWVTVGTAGFSTGSVTDFQSLAIHPTTGEPYIAYRDGANSNKTTVMYFTSGAWTVVGTAGFSAGNAYDQSLVFHPTTNEPYVAYSDVANSEKTTVMRFNGTAWVTVGTAGFSAGQSVNQSLAIHPTTGEPYVAYYDVGNGGKTTVMRFNGTTWVNVGTAGFSAGVAIYQSLAFHPTTNEPYVAYMDFANSNKTTVMRFDGTTWVNVGTAGFSAGSSISQSLAFHPTTGEPYVAYSDGGNSSKTTVMRYPFPPEINLQGNTQNIVDGDAVPTTADHTDFTATGISTPLVRTFTIQNTGAGTLNITSISNSNTTDYTVGGLSLPATISAGSSATFTVTLNSATMGTKTATITVNSDDADEGVYDFAITGRVINATPSNFRGNMMDFNGASNVLCGGFSDFTAYTIEGWFKPTSTSTQTVIVLSNVAGPTNAYSHQIAINAGKWTHYLYDGGAKQIADANTITANTWYHVAITAQNGGAMNLYVDGVLVTTFSSLATLSTGLDRFYFGVASKIFAANTAAYQGAMDEVRIWNTARTQAQIRENMHLTMAGTESGLVAYYQFNETSGNAIDAITGKNGTLNSATRTASTVSVAKGVATRQTVSTTGNQVFGNATVNFTAVSAPAANDEFVTYQLYDRPLNNVSATNTASNYWIVRQFGSQTFSYDQMSFTLPASNVISTTAPASDMKLFKRVTNSGGAWGTEIGTGTSASNITKIVAYNLSPVQTSFSEFSVASVSSALPISLIGFQASRVTSVQGKMTEEVKLSWTTAQEIGNKGFEVETSEDGLAYQKIAFVDGKGTSNSLNIYHVSFINPNDAYYRLRQVDFDGKFSYSPVVFVEGLAGKIAVYPNPNKGAFTISVGKDKLDSPARLLNAVGKEVWRGVSTDKVCLVSTGLPAGVYFLHTTIAGKTKITKVVIEQ